MRFPLMVAAAIISVAALFGTPESAEPAVALDRHPAQSISALLASLGVPSLHLALRSAAPVVSVQANAGTCSDPQKTCCCKETFFGFYMCGTPEACAALPGAGSDGVGTCSNTPQPGCQ